MGPVTGTCQLHRNLHIRVELDTCQLGGPYPGSMQKLDHFWHQISPCALLLSFCFFQFSPNSLAAIYLLSIQDCHELLQDPAGSKVARQQELRGNIDH